MVCSFEKKLKISPRQLKVLVNSEWLFFEKLLRMGIGILISAWTARISGSDDYGQLRYALSFASLFVPFAEMGLNTLSVREFVGTDTLKGSIFRTLYTLKLIGGILAVAFCTLAAAILHQEEDFTRVLIGFVSLGILFQAFDVVEFWFQSKLESKYTVYGKTIAFLISASIKAMLIVTRAPLLAFAFVIVVESALNSLLLIIVLRWKSRSGLNVGISISDTRRLLALCYPLIFSGLLKILFLRIDQVMLSNILGSKELGIYAVAVQIAEGLFFIPDRSCTIHISQLWWNRKGKAKATSITNCSSSTICRTHRIRNRSGRIDILRWNHQPVIWAGVRAIVGNFASADMVHSLHSFRGRPQRFFNFNGYDQIPLFFNGRRVHSERRPQSILDSQLWWARCSRGIHNLLRLRRLSVQFLLPAFI